MRFDWAIKTLLRDKANFDVLELIVRLILPQASEVMANCHGYRNSP
jgi:hypothetical protein